MNDFDADLDDVSAASGGTVCGVASPIYSAGGDAARAASLPPNPEPAVAPLAAELSEPLGKHVAGFEQEFLHADGTALRRARSFDDLETAVNLPFP